MWTEKFRILYWIDHGCKLYVVCELYARMHAQTKFSIEHTSVGLAYARPIMQGFIHGGTWEIPPPNLGNNM